MPPMYRRPWYTKLADAAHRLTVLGIIGFSVYLAGGIGMTLYANRDTARRARIEEEQQVRTETKEGTINERYILTYFLLRLLMLKRTPRPQPPKSLPLNQYV